MDQLDLLKKDWKKQESSLPKLSFEDITKLIHKKSSSIVKWIFIISVLEFLLPHLVYFLVDFKKGATKGYLELGNFYIVINIVFYTIVLVFIYLFYRNYRSISANSNPKVLMQNIIKTRKIVKYYIWFSLSMIPLVGGVLFYKAIYSEEFLEKIPEGTNMMVVWGIVVLVLLLLVCVFYLFYRLIYGTLLNKLKANYNELMSNGNGESLQDI